MTYSKSDVTFHRDGWSDPRPAVNVKTHPYDWDSPANVGAARDYDPEIDPRFEEWYRGIDEGLVEHLWGFACEVAWEYLQRDAEALFGPGVKVYAEGRSGGWAVVDGLPEFESWDAIMLGRWATFERWARVYAEAVPGEMSILASMNQFERWLETQPSQVSLMLAPEGVGL